MQFHSKQIKNPATVVYGRRKGSKSFDAGYDYSGTTGIDYDIDLITRSGTWDIGADEYVSAVVARNRLMIIQ